MGVLSRMSPAWRAVAVLVQPAPILRWHREGFRIFWRARSRQAWRRASTHGALIRHNAARPHQGIAQGQPVPRVLQTEGEIVAKQVLAVFTTTTSGGRRKGSD